MPGLDNDAHNANDPSMNCKNWHDAECLGSKLSIERRVAKQEKYKNKVCENASTSYNQCLAHICDVFPIDCITTTEI